MVIVVVARETVEDACRLPATVSGPLTVEDAAMIPPLNVARPLAKNVEEKVDDAAEINPLFRLASPPTLNVLDADIGPEIVRLADTVEDAVERNPFVNEERLEKLASPVTLRILEKVEEAEEIRPFKKEAKPPWVDVLETMNWEVEAFPVTANDVEVAFAMVALLNEAVLEDWNDPATWSGPLTVEEALEINPLPIVSIPVVEALARFV